MPTPLRTKWATGLAIGGAGATVSFDEATPLDNTHLLVAVVAASSNAVPTASGWTLIASGGGTARRTAVYARQGDGSANSITVVAGGGLAAVTLMAFAGYSSLTPLSTGGAAPTTATYALALSSTPAGYGVVLAAVMSTSSAGSAIGAWSNSYVETGESTAGPRAAHAYRTYDGTDASVTVTVSSNTNGAWVLAALELAPPATVSYALGADPVSLALGANENITAVVGAGP